MKLYNTLARKTEEFVPFKAGELNASGLGGKLLTYTGLEHFGNILTRMRDIFEQSLDIRLPRPSINTKELLG